MITKQDQDRHRVKQLDIQVQTDIEKRLAEVEFYLFNKTGDSKQPNVFEKLEEKILDNHAAAQ